MKRNTFCGRSKSFWWAYLEKSSRYVVCNGSMRIRDSLERTRFLIDLDSFRHAANKEIPPLPVEQFPGVR